MGMLIVAPALLSWEPQRLFQSKSATDLIERTLLLLVATVATSILFVQQSIPWLFVVPPILLWAAIRFELFTTAVAGLLVSGISVWLTIDVSGPIASIGDTTLGQRILFLQIFLATSVLPPLFVAVALAERKRATDALAEYSKHLEGTNTALETAVEQRDNLLMELQHRVKNSLQVVVSLLNLRSDGVAEPPAKQAIIEASHRVEALALAHRFFYQKGAPHRLALSEFLPELSNLLVRSYAIEESRIEVITEAANISIPFDKATPVVLMLNELVSNAFKHAFPGGRSGTIKILIEAELGDERSCTIHIAVSDDGIGFPTDLSLEDVASIGLKVFLGLANQIDARLEIDRELGTTFHIRFELEDEETKAETNLQPSWSQSPSPSSG